MVVCPDSYGRMLPDTLDASVGILVSMNYERRTPHFGGRLDQTLWSTQNSLQMSRNEWQRRSQLFSRNGPYWFPLVFRHAGVCSHSLRTTGDWTGKSE